MNVLVLHVIFLNLQVYALELPGVAGNAWNDEPGCSIAIGSSCIWGKFIFLATGRPGDCMEMLLECLRNPGYRLGIAIVCSRPAYLERSKLWQPPWTVQEESKVNLCIDSGAWFELEQPKSSDLLRFKRWCSMMVVG
eukprot:Gb_27537 [translate_table: standard]